MNATAASTDLQRLHGKIVLITSMRDFHHPPTGCRGTIEVQSRGQPPDVPPVVKLTWEIPDMFNEAAHRHVVTLRNEESIRRLLASEHEGTFEFILDRDLD